jgi:hypothetical protein
MNGSPRLHPASTNLFGYSSDASSWTAFNHFQYVAFQMGIASWRSRCTHGMAATHIESISSKNVISACLKWPYLRNDYLSVVCLLEHLDSTWARKHVLELWISYCGILCIVKFLASAIKELRNVCSTSFPICSPYDPTYCLSTLHYFCRWDIVLNYPMKKQHNKSLVL